MPEANDALSTFAEVAVALAGFSGIVIAFGGRSAGSLSKLEARRLSNLFTLSGAALTLSLLGMSLLYMELLSPRVLCTWGSAVVFFLATPWLIGDVVKIQRLEVAERAQVSMPLVIFFDSLAVAMMLLQLANWLFLKEQWPFYLALVLIIAGAFQQFILLVQTGFRDD